PGPAERERRADDRRIADLTRDRARLVERAGVTGPGQREPDALHRLLEERPVLRLPDRLELGADQLDAESIEGAVLGQRDRDVQCGLAAESRQQRLGPLTLDDLRHELRSEERRVGKECRTRVSPEQ